MTKLVLLEAPPNLWAADRLQRPLGHWPNHPKAKRQQFECHMLAKSNLFSCTMWHVGSKFPNHRLKPMPPALKAQRVLTPGPAGKSGKVSFWPHFLVELDVLGGDPKVLQAGPRDAWCCWCGWYYWHARVQEEEEGGHGVTPEHQGEAHEYDPAPEKVRKLRSPTKKRANETSKRAEPTAHLCCEFGGGGSLHTWDTMRSSRLLIVMMTTTAKVATLQATSMPVASLGTWAWLESQRKCSPVWLEPVQKYHSLKRSSARSHCRHRWRRSGGPWPGSHKGWWRLGEGF